ncbi:MAG: hypothetical protein M3Q29_18570, partial [Chloroflexota bacterium]|nr:hypothetical protein [Chloroflexota bacterium]
RCLLTLFATTGAGRDARMRRVAVFGMLAARSRRRHADFEIALGATPAALRRDAIHQPESTSGMRSITSSWLRSTRLAG